MTSKKTGKAMPLFLITLDKTVQNNRAVHITSPTFAKHKGQLWEQRAKNATAHQQPNPTTTKSHPKPPPLNSYHPPPNQQLIFLNNLTPSCKRHLRSPEQFITIAHTIPTKYGRLAIKQLGDEINFNPRNSNRSHLTVISWNANGIRSKVEEFRSFIAHWNPDIINFKKPT
ncbi:hypothetical protein TNIN_100131 [Trichonephila inaurata madagascariensis]|uniref:Uncharacterized protein n=1 Tax=Trichonephila inaurata madagascariensis TaxID=2747483 RepID=A0A8X7C3Y2_9ARAC|nr:hypothetical protein TNIN_100131 [Trichonephila inaurata madagascariensis]